MAEKPVSIGERLVSVATEEAVSIGERLVSVVAEEPVSIGERLVSVATEEAVSIGERLVSVAAEEPVSIGERLVSVVTKEAVRPSYLGYISLCEWPNMRDIWASKYHINMIILLGSFKSAFFKRRIFAFRQ